MDFPILKPIPRQVAPEAGGVRWIRRLPLVSHAGDASVAVGRDAIFITGTSWGGGFLFMRDTSFWIGAKRFAEALVNEPIVDRYVWFSRQRIFSLAPFDGAIRWSVQIAAGPRALRNLSGTPALIRDLVIVSSPVGLNLTALDQKTGRKAWVASLPSRHRGVPTIIAIR